MFPLNAFLPDLAIIIVVLSVFILGTILWKPRIWLHDFPADIQALTPPKTAEEKRLTTLIGVPLVLLFFVLPALLSLDFTFVNVWVYSYALFFGFNLWDLVALDWVGFTLTDPQNPPFPGTEGAAGWRDYAFHFYGFLKGCVMGLVFATVNAGLVMVLA